MTDDVRHGPTAPDTPGQSQRLVPLDIVSGEFIAAGLPRSMRSLQRYCNNGTLDCVKEATETGDAYFVHAHSVATAIESLKQLHDAKARQRQSATEPAMSHSVATPTAPQVSPDNDRHSPTTSDTDAGETSQHESATEPDTSRYVAQLEARLGEKDAEIAFLRDELTDRRGQIRDMKGIIDGQNQLLETIQTNVAPIFNALAATVRSKGLGLSADPSTESDSLHDADAMTEAANQDADKDDRQQHGEPSFPTHPQLS